jgi:hypothetical protein
MAAAFVALGPGVLAMSASLRALLTGLIDYAGLFPPAELPLEQALRNYARYRTEPESWMLGRFVCPAARLDDVSPFVDELFGSGPPLVIAALGRGGPDAREFLAGLHADQKAIHAFRERHGARVMVNHYEVRLPPDVLRSENGAALGKLVDDVENAIAGQAPSLTPFYEMPFGGDWRATLARVFGTLFQDVYFGASRCLLQGFKLRCGGLTAVAVLTTEQVAATLVKSRDFQAPLKCTAGLHHPFRRYDPSLGTATHGFVNVFGAGVLAVHRNLNEKDIQQVLDDEESGDFRFDPETFRWKDHQVSVEEIALARRLVMASFGSCSFEEPREDLRALGLLAG